ncbi:putative ribonuclease H-like domain-containing protein [Tanacetum coccineum]
MIKSAHCSSSELKQLVILSYSSFKDFVVYQKDVKSAFLYGMIEEEVYVCQPPGFEDPNFPDRVYKVEKVLYGFASSSRKPWYDTLSTYLLENSFKEGKDNARPVYQNRLKKSLSTEFEKMMHKKFQISSMGELTFFLGLQVKHKEDGIFINQDKYVTEILKKFGFTNVKTASTPMETKRLCSKMQMPDIMFEVLLDPKIKLLIMDITYRLRLIIDNEILSTRCLEWNERYAKDEIGFWDTVKAKLVNGEVQLQALVDKKKVIITESTIRRDLQLEDANGVDCLPNAAIFEQLTLMGGPTEHIADEVPNEENVPTQSNDPPLSRVNTLGSGEDRLTLKELIDLCTKLSDRVLDLETIKIAQAKAVASLKRRVKKLERKRKSKTLGMKRLFKIGRSAQVVSY